MSAHEMNALMTPNKATSHRADGNSIQNNAITIDIYCIGGEISYGLASTAEPRGWFMVAVRNGVANVNTIPKPHTSITVTPSVGCIAPTASACMDIFAKKCEHVRVGDKLHANFGWLLSIAHYIKAKYANMVIPAHEQEFLATQLSGYGPGFAEHHLSQSQCAKLYPVSLSSAL